MWKSLTARALRPRHEIVEIGKDSAILVAEGPPLPGSEPSCSLTLATAIPKGERFDWLVEKATELGVARLIPMVTEHSVVDPRRIQARAPETNNH